MQPFQGPSLILGMRWDPQALQPKQGVGNHPPHHGDGGASSPVLGDYECRATFYSMLCVCMPLAESVDVGTSCHFIVFPIVPYRGFAVDTFPLSNKTINCGTRIEWFILPAAPCHSPAACCFYMRRPNVCAIKSHGTGSRSGTCKHFLKTDKNILHLRDLARERFLSSNETTPSSGWINVKMLENLLLLVYVAIILLWPKDFYSTSSPRR